jgi:hypothetical protein
MHYFISLNHQMLLAWAAMALLVRIAVPVFAALTRFVSSRLDYYTDTIHTIPVHYW